MTNWFDIARRTQSTLFPKTNNSPNYEFHLKIKETLACWGKCESRPLRSANFISIMRCILCDNSESVSGAGPPGTLHVKCHKPSETV